MVSATAEVEIPAPQNSWPGKLTGPQVPNWVPGPGGMNGAEKQMCFRLFYWKLKDISSVWLGRDGQALP